MRHEESRIQQACVSWFRWTYPDLALNLIAVPNGYKTTATQARIAKAEGLTAGAADLLLFVPSGKYHCLAIEMKTAVGRQQPTQKRWQEAVERFGYKYTVARGLDDFILEIRDYLGDWMRSAYRQQGEQSN